MTELETTLAEDIANARNVANDVWMRAHLEQADRELIAFLAVAYDQLGRAMKCGKQDGND